MRPQTLISLAMASNEAEDMSGRTSAEIERVLYCRVGNFDFLDKANAAERQEQWSVKIEKTEENSGSGSIRVRKSINLREPGTPAVFVLATKLDVGQKGSSAETPEQSSEDQFKVFKYFGNKGMLKDRYSYDIPETDLKWEVDCFPKEGQLYSEWVKVDLEKWPRGKALPELPFEALEMIDGSAGYLTAENEAKVKELYDSIFLIPNQMTPLMNYEPEEGEESQATDEEGQQKANDPVNQGSNDESGNDPAASGNEDAGGTGGTEGGEDDAGGNPGAGSGGDAGGTGSDDAAGDDET